MNKLLHIFFVRLFFVVSFGFIIAFLLYMPCMVGRWYNKKTITILAWPHMLDASGLMLFQERTGVKVQVRYVESNDELLTKLESDSLSAYDLIMPTDYMVEILVKKGLLKKIDKSKLHMFKDIHPALLDHYYDPKNQYTIPFYWGIYGLGIDYNVISRGVVCGWDLLFNENIAPKGVGMGDDARLLVLLAAYYLYGMIDDIDTVKINEIKQLLIAQKRWVRAYTDMRAEYLLASHTCPVVLLLSSDASRIMPYSNNIGFCVPPEGSFAVIDSFALPVSGQHEEIVYELLNYIYEAPVLSHYVEKFGFFSPSSIVTSPYSMLHHTIENKINDLFARAIFLRSSMTSEQFTALYVSLKN